MRLSPAMLGLSAAIQLKVEETLLVSGMLSATLSQTIPVFVLVTSGAGFTVTFTFCVAPAQPKEDVGITV